eukprot:2604788-Prymnesium_polylepis.1
MRASAVWTSNRVKVHLGCCCIVSRQGHLHRWLPTWRVASSSPCRSVIHSEASAPYFGPLAHDATSYRLGQHEQSWMLVRSIPLPCAWSSLPWVPLAAVHLASSAPFSWRG